MKLIFWQGSTLKDVGGFTKLAKRMIGHELMRVQARLEPSDWKPMSSIGKGVREIRVHADKEYRVLYVTKINDVIHVLHVLVKKSQKTSKKDIEIAKSRYQELFKQM